SRFVRENRGKCGQQTLFSCPGPCGRPEYASARCSRRNTAGCIRCTACYGSACWNLHDLASCLRSCRSLARVQEEKVRKISSADSGSITITGCAAQTSHPALVAADGSARSSP